jgi:hypothetical protein
MAAATARAGLNDLADELLDVVVGFVRRDPHGRITVPGLAACARNRRVCRRFRAASARVPAAPYDCTSQLRTTDDGAMYMGAIVGGKLFRSRTWIANGLVLARWPATGRVEAHLVTEERPFPDPTTPTTATPPMDHPAPEWRNGPRHPLCLRYKLDLRECVRVFSGQNADFNLNIKLFDQMCYGIVGPDGKRQNRTLQVNLLEYDANESHAQVIDAAPSEGELMRAEADRGTPIPNWTGVCATYFSTEYRHPTSSSARLGNVVGLEIKFAARMYPYDLAEVFRQGVSTRMGRTPDSAAWCCATVGPADDDPPGPVADKDNFWVAVPPLSAAMGYFDAPAHAQCGDWYVHIQSHGYTDKQLRVLVGRPQRHDMEAYRRQIAKLALDRAERRRAEQTALVLRQQPAAQPPTAHPLTAASAPRMRPREAALKAREATGACVRSDNSVFNTGRVDAALQDQDSRDDEAAGLVDDCVAGHDEAMLEDNLVDDDYDYDPDDARPEREKKRARLQEALAENDARREAAAQQTAANPEADDELEDL